MTLFDYILRANLFLALFYACYWLLLRRHTFFALNRAYLLGAAIGSLVLPLIELPSDTVQTVVLPVAVTTLPALVIQPESTGPDWMLIGWGLYGVLVFLLLGRLEARTVSLLRFIRRSKQQPMDDYTLVWPSDPQTPTFSFFRYFVLNPADASAEPVHRHELVHIRQWHSLDVLFFEIIQAVFWFNPVLWLYKQSIRQVHEFLADKEAANEQYAAYLVEYAFGLKPDRLANSFFNSSQLKARIAMLGRGATSRWALGKYLMVLPLALGLLAMTTAREQLDSLVETSQSQAITVKGQVKHPNGKALANVSVIVQNTTTGTTTDDEGLYELKNIPDNSVLVFSYVGLGTAQVEVKGRKVVNVQLTQSPQTLNEIVIVGYSMATAVQRTPASQTMVKGKEVFTVVEEMPSFPGGQSELGRYLARSIRYPAEAHRKNIQGTVQLSFIISDEGGVRQPRVIKGIGGGCDEEALRVVLGMPHWNPGKQNGKAIDVEYVLPIKFALEQSSSTSKPATGDTTGWNPSFQLKAPGQSTNIQLRGSGLGDKHPLYIIDGIVMDGDYELKKLNPNTIQEINVLKGVSATGVYGEKGVNGVILITTKGAKK